MIQMIVIVVFTIGATASYRLTRLGVNVTNGRSGESMKATPSCQHSVQFAAQKYFERRLLSVRGLENGLDGSLGSTYVIKRVRQ